MRWNYKNLFIAFLITVLAVFGIYFVVEKYVIGTTVTFEEGVIVTEESEELIISKILTFEEGAANNLELETYQSYPFIYNEPFGDDVKYEIIIPYDFHYVGIRRVSDSKLTYYQGKVVDVLYEDKTFHEALLNQKKVVFQLGDQAVDSGYVTYISAENVKIPEFLHIESDYADLQFIKYKDRYVAMLPFDYTVEPGTKHVNVSYDAYGGAYEEGFDISVNNREYSSQRLYISKNIVQEKKTKKAREEHALLMKKVFDKAEYEYDGDVSDAYKGYSLPISGRVTTEYGVTRYVNDSLSPYTHIGVDLAQPEGKVIKASKDGKVVCAEPASLTGNTVVISHGLGFYSVYYHLRKMYVSEGDIVKQNLEIGEVGTTGFSTGPHLHFEITFKDTRLEPGNFIYGEAITYDNYNRLFYQ